MFERQECCFRTCISARFEGKKVEDYLTLNLVPGLKNGSVVRFVEGVFVDCFVVGCVMRN